MAALDFLNLDLSLVSAFRLVEKLGSIISWMCPYFAAACKTDNMYVRTALPAGFQWSEIAKLEGCRFPLGPSQEIMQQLVPQVEESSRGTSAHLPPLCPLPPKELLSGLPGLILVGRALTQGDLCCLRETPVLLLFVCFSQMVNT